MEEDFDKVNLDLRVREFAVSVVKDGVQRAVPTWGASLVERSLSGLVLGHKPALVAIWKSRMNVLKKVLKL